MRFRRASAPKRRRIRKLRLLALMFVLGLLGLTSFSFGLLEAISTQIPALDPAREAQVQRNTDIYAADGHTILAVLRGSEARIVVPSGRISPWLKHAIVSVEDKRFYEHRGVDIKGIARALYSDVTKTGVVQGGSTITQQFVKNAINGNAPTITRKLKEAALAWQLEQRWSKDRILTAYLNTIYFGNGAYGAQEACLVYFGHGASPAEMTIAEAALLAGIPEDPSLYNPVAHPAHAKSRRNLVLLQMLSQHFISPAQYLRALRTPMPNPANVRLPSTQSLAAPYFANYVTDQLVRQFGPSKVYGGGLRVKTTIDLKLQQAARDAIEKVLPASVGPTAALVSIDVHTGAILAMIGGRNYRTSQFNLATQGERQPGSAFKPFVLAAALKNGIAPASVLPSKQVTLDIGGRLWVVNNYEHEYLGPINLTKALAYSDNAVFAQLTNLIGPAEVARTATSLGITTPLSPYFAIGLGAEPATPLEMARAYATLANGGNRIDSSLFGNEPRAVACLGKVDLHGNVSCGQDNAVVSRPILSSTQAAAADYMLEQVVSYGTGTAAQLPGRAVAGKTGTTENYGDAWFVGFTPDIVTAVWIGYPDGLKPMLHEFHGHAVTGGSFPALIWKAYMEKALAYLKVPPTSFPYPPSLYGPSVTVVNRGGKIVRNNGYCKNALPIVFYDTSRIDGDATCKKNEVAVPRVVGMTVADAKARLLTQPLLTTIVYRPATPGERLGVVISQLPRVGGKLSAYDHVTLVVPKATYGAVPQLVGLTVPEARARLAKAKLGVRLIGGTSGQVIAQSPAANVAAWKGLRVTLTVHGPRTRG